MHIKKLCVGVDEPAELAIYQQWRMQRDTSAPWHDTRAFPKQAEEILASGGSLYWIMRGKFRARQQITDIIPHTDALGKRWCRLCLAPKLVLVEPIEHRPFQGWRYLQPCDAPSDIVLLDDSADILG